ncbi:MAG: TolC family protein [Marinicella pacifica]
MTTQKLIIVFLMVGFYADQVKAETPVNLQQLLMQSIKHTEQNSYSFTSLETTEVAVSKWLGDTPSLQLSTLYGSDSLTADEYEANVQLPIKSGSQRQLDGQLVKQNQYLQQQQQQMHRWYLSGLIREVLWQRIISEQQLQIANRKIKWLQQQQRSAEVLAENNQLSRTQLVMIKNAILQTQIDIASYNEQLNLARHHYQALTGIEVLPDMYREHIRGEFLQYINDHPQIRLLQAQLDQAELLYENNLSSQQNWQLGVVAKQVRHMDYHENQMGVQVSIPIKAMKTVSQADQLSWQNSQQEIALSLQKSHTDIKQTWLQLQSEQRRLQKRQALLAQQAELAQQLMSQLQQVYEMNEITQSVYLQQMIQAQDDLFAADMNQLYIERNKARQNQTLGIPL